MVTEHYTAVGASLLATLKEFLGPSWTPDLADTWAQAYGLVAKVMVAAAEQHEDVAPASWEADVVRVERRSVEVAVVEVAPREPFSYRAGQSVAVEIPSDPGCGVTSARRMLRIRRGVCSFTSSRSRVAWCPARWSVD